MSTLYGNSDRVLRLPFFGLVERRLPDGYEERNLQGARALAFSMIRNVLRGGQIPTRKVDLHAYGPGAEYLIASRVYGFENGNEFQSRHGAQIGEIGGVLRKSIDFERLDELPADGQSVDDLVQTVAGGGFSAAQLKTWRKWLELRKAMRDAKSLRDIHAGQFVYDVKDKAWVLVEY